MAVRDLIFGVGDRISGWGRVVVDSDGQGADGSITGFATVAGTWDGETLHVESLTGLDRLTWPMSNGRIGRRHRVILRRADGRSE